MKQSEIFSIRQMIELTGLSEFTIRGWENRYSAFQPERSDTGRREYCKEDVERALLLRELLKRGHKIGKVAKLSNQKLKRLFEQADANHQNENSEQNSEIISTAMELVALQKWVELKSLIRKIPSKNTGDLIHKFLLPALRSLSLNVNAGMVSVSQEHIFSSFLKEKIYSALSETENTSFKMRKKIHFVLATPEGDYHEIGLLLAHLLIRSYGFTSLFLGPHTPARDLSETALRFSASHVLIVSTISKKGGAGQELLSYVSEVQKGIGSRLQILVAGSQAPLISSDSNPSLLNLATFQHFENYLEKLKG